MSDEDKCIKNDGVVFFETQRFSSIQNILHIALSSIVTIQVKECKKVVDLFDCEDRIFDDINVKS